MLKRALLIAALAGLGFGCDDASDRNNPSGPADQSGINTTSQDRSSNLPSDSSERMTGETKTSATDADLENGSRSDNVDKANLAGSSKQDQSSSQGSSAAQQNQPSPSGQTPAQQGSASDESAMKVSESDKQFVMKAAGSGLFEVQSSQLALQKSQDPQIKAFAQQMIDDHQKANDQLKQIASRKGLDVPDKLDAEHQALYDKLSKLQGAEFDKQFHDIQAKAHQQAVELFDHASGSLADEELKTFASKTLPTLKQHQESVQSHQQDQNQGDKSSPQDSGNSDQPASSNDSNTK